MKKHRYKVSFSITTFIYVSLTLAYIYYMSQYFVVSQKEKDTVINISLSQFVPKAIEVPEPQEETKIEEPEPIEEEKIEPKPIVKEEPTPQPVIIEKPKPIVKKEVKKPKKIVKKKKIKKQKKLTKKKFKKKTTSKRASSKRATSKRVDPNKKSKFLAKLRAKINSAKSYPKMAKRRGMQGVIKVRFTILKNGNVSNISMSGPKVFYRSVKKAIKSAFPISKKAPLSLPTSCNIKLNYRLR